VDAHEFGIEVERLKLSPSVAYLILPLPCVYTICFQNELQIEGGHERRVLVVGHPQLEGIQALRAEQLFLESPESQILSHRGQVTHQTDQKSVPM
jgi:hypothetical protein